MSMHVYVSNPGFKDQPISYDQWISAAKKVSLENENFVLVEQSYRKTEKSFHFGRLTSSGRQRLTLDVYGLIHAQDPTEELIDIMFKLAKELDAKVYSERLKPYKNITDWQKRTENYRTRRNERMAISKKKRRKKQALWSMYILLIVTVSYYVAKHG